MPGLSNPPTNLQQQPDNDLGYSGTKKERACYGIFFELMDERKRHTLGILSIGQGVAKCVTCVEIPGRSPESIWLKLGFFLGAFSGPPGSTHITH